MSRASCGARRRVTEIRSHKHLKYSKASLSFGCSKLQKFVTPAGAAEPCGSLRWISASATKWYVAVPTKSADLDAPRCASADTPPKHPPFICTDPDTRPR